MNEAEVKQLRKDFTVFWQKHGKPDPISNDYINLTQVFYYTQGFEKGVKITTEMLDVKN